MAKKNAAKKPSKQRTPGMLDAIRDHQICRASTIPSGRQKASARLRREKISRHDTWE